MTEPASGLLAGSSLFEIRGNLRQSLEMTSSLRWVAWVIVGWLVITTAIRAFWVPWTWNAVQWEFVILLALVSVGPAMWGYIWVRGGSEAVEARRAALRAAAAKPLSKRFYAWSLLFWIAVALALVVLFNFLAGTRH